MMRFREEQRVARKHTVRPQLDLSVLSAVHFHHGLLDTADAAALEEFPISQEAAGNVQSGTAAGAASSCAEATMLAVKVMRLATAKNMKNFFIIVFCVVSYKLN